MKRTQRHTKPDVEIINLLTSQQEDCYYYFNSECTNPECEYRHCARALGSTVICQEWEKYQRCVKFDCPRRHVNIKNPAKIWCYYDSRGGCSNLACPYKHQYPRKVASSTNSHTADHKASIPCRYEKHPDGCTNANCRYLHLRKPECLTDKANKMSRTACKFEKHSGECTKVNCPYLHRQSLSSEELSFETLTISDANHNSDETVDDYSKNECKVCFECEIDTVFLDCSHMVCCTKCAEQMGDRYCPICRKKIIRAIKVYKS